jgi:alkaline phosphatase
VSAAQAADPLYRDGQAALKRALTVKPNTRRAKNVILFIGDGMGLSTVVASRIYEGQARGVDGESNSLAFERLPHSALSKTYSVDTQVVDSAASATALMTGVKTRNRVVGLGGGVTPQVCAGEAANRLTTIAELARARGMAAGAVTTTTLTHATPAAVYAHSAFRDWEADFMMPAEAKAAGCVDIARQLVEAPLSTRLNVAFGGGRNRFQSTAGGGRRADGLDLTRAWTAAPRSAYVASADALAALRPGQSDHVLGLFGPDHLPYEADRATQGAGVPTLAQMTTKAIDLLSTNRRGYFLMVEGGKIDHANHANNAKRALTETVAFSEAITAALAKVDLRDTLVIVTADHSHGLVISGYAERNAPILGIAGDEGAPIKASDGKPYTTLSYATGPGGPRGDEHRDDPSTLDLQAVGTRQDATVHLPSSAHSGEDVPIYAGGPRAYLLDGVVEESYVFHVMRYALGL